MSGANAVADESFESLIETGKLLFVVPRRDVRKWAAYIDRESGLRSLTRIAVIREHLSVLDSKTGPMTGVAGVLVAATALLGNTVLAQGLQPRSFESGAFIFMLVSTALCTVYTMSALGVEVPDDAITEKSQAAFEFRLLQRLVYRARNHAWGLRSAQTAALAAVILVTVLGAR